MNLFPCIVDVEISLSIEKRDGLCPLSLNLADRSAPMADEPVYEIFHGASHLHF